MRHVKFALCINKACGFEVEPKPDITVCPKCGEVLEVVYDYDYLKSVVDRDALSASREFSFWRYKAFLPVEESSEAPPLRVGWSPLYERRGILGLDQLYIKDDGQNPTGSLKDRPSALCIVKAREAGRDSVACASTGNAASSLAGNAAAAGMGAYIFVPERAPKGKLAQLLVFGANVISVQGDYQDTFRLSAQAIERWGWYTRNAAINPYLMEGKKTVALEICEQLNWEAPDWVAISVGDGCSLAAVWKGFYDFYQMGFITKLPRLLSVQATGCYPINQAFRDGVEEIIPMAENTLADSIAVGVPRNGKKALRAIGASNGLTIEVTDQEILDAMCELGRDTGVFGEPAGVTGFAGLKKAVAQGLIRRDEKVVTIITGNGLKDTASALKAAGEPISSPPDMDALLRAFGARGLDLDSR
ncbi:MAG: threonine synthase [Oscillospiraceae bacterium]|nr:threonine synthase [Oscillospiraceae bacterium]